MMVSFGRGSCSGNASKKVFLVLNAKDLVTVVGYRLKRGLGRNYLVTSLAKVVSLRDMCTHCETRLQ